jgi:hypothetical protein
VLRGDEDEDEDDDDEDVDGTRVVERIAAAA